MCQTVGIIVGTLYNSFNSTISCKIGANGWASKFVHIYINIRHLRYNSGENLSIYMFLFSPERLLYCNVCRDLHFFNDLCFYWPYYLTGLEFTLPIHSDIYITKLLSNTGYSCLVPDLIQTSQTNRD